MKQLEIIHTLVIYNTWPQSEKMGGKKREETEEAQQNNSEYGKTVSEFANCNYGCISESYSWSISQENNAIMQQAD